MDRCAISLGVGQKYEAGLQRMLDGLQANGFDGDCHLFHDYPEGCPTHSEIPYGFKPWLIDWARRRGCQQVLWMDSACVPVKPLGPLLEKLGKRGIILPYSPFRIWEWCSDACAEQMGVSRAKLMGMCPSIWACTMLMDFSHEIANEFLDRWLEYSRDGISFHGDYENIDGSVSDNPEVKGHRHDQTVACILAFEMGITFDWNVTEYDHQNTLKIGSYANSLRQPNAQSFILAQHDVKTKPHATGDTA